MAAQATRVTTQTRVAKPSTGTVRGTSALNTVDTEEQNMESPRPREDFAEIRKALEQRQEELHAEHTRALADLATLQEGRNADTSGEDQADTGNKTFEREQGLVLANGILERINQVGQALNRLDDGTYGQCERCGNPIPKARLEAFPAATLCISCKQRQERR